MLVLSVPDFSVSGESDIVSINPNGIQAIRSINIHDRKYLQNIMRLLVINSPSLVKYALDKLIQKSTKNKPSTVNSTQNQSDHGYVSISAIRYGIIVAV